MAVRYVVHSPVSIIRRTMARGNCRLFFILSTLFVTLLFYSLLSGRSSPPTTINPPVNTHFHDEAHIKQVSKLVNIAREEQTKNQELEAAKVTEKTTVLKNVMNVTHVVASKVVILENNIKKMVQADESKQLALNSSNFNILMLLAKVTHISPLARKLQRCIQSICAYTSLELNFHFVTDVSGETAIAEVFKSLMKLRCGKKVNIFFYDVKKVAESTKSVTDEYKRLLKFEKRSYYSDPLFFLSLTIHKVLSTQIKKIIILDSDLLFTSDIRTLFKMFDDFDNKQIMGMAREQQPVYRHMFYSYRSSHPQTAVGGPPPDGITGFNSGVVLMDLQKMRLSEIYNEMVLRNIGLLQELCQKYEFTGNLGDQDIFTLISIEHMYLFYALPCQWNRQLCTWWKDKGYNNVFNLYFKCPEPIYVYHGNCDTKIPEG